MLYLNEVRETAALVVKQGESTFVQLDGQWYVVRFKDSKVDLLLPVVSSMSTKLSDAVAHYRKDNDQ